MRGEKILEKSSTKGGLDSCGPHPDDITIGRAEWRVTICAARPRWMHEKKWVLPGGMFVTQETAITYAYRFSKMLEEACNNELE